MALSAKQELFKDEYLSDLNATAAAKRCGYSEKTAYSQGQRLLKHVEVGKAIQEAMDKRAQNAVMTAADTLNTIGRVIAACEENDPVKNASAILKGCELYGKHHKLFTDKVEVDGDLTVVLKRYTKEED